MAVSCVQGPLPQAGKQRRQGPLRRVVGKATAGGGNDAAVRAGLPVDSTPIQACARDRPLTDLCLHDGVTLTMLQPKLPGSGFLTS